MVSCWRPPRGKATRGGPCLGAGLCPSPGWLRRVVSLQAEQGAGSRDPGRAPQAEVPDTGRCAGPAPDTGGFSLLPTRLCLCLWVAGLFLPPEQNILFPTWQGQQDADAESHPVASRDPAHHPPPLLRWPPHQHCLPEGGKNNPSQQCWEKQLPGNLLCTLQDLAQIAPPSTSLYEALCSS